MRLHSDRYDEIQKSVVKMYMKYNISRIPVDCFLICKKKNILLRKYSSLSSKGLSKSMKISQDGYCILVEEVDGREQWYIFYNDTKPKKRVRFTIMHEIAHIELNHTEHSDLAEAEANFFAKYALAPPPLINHIHPDDYLDLSRCFDISKELAFYSMQFYNKWLKFGASQYLDYEIIIINLFGLSG